MGGVIRLRGLRLSPLLPVLPPIQSCRPSEPKNRQYDMVVWYDMTYVYGTNDPLPHTHTPESLGNGALSRSKLCQSVLSTSIFVRGRAHAYVDIPPWGLSLPPSFLPFFLPFYSTYLPNFSSLQLTYFFEENLPCDGTGLR